MPGHWAQLGFYSARLPSDPSKEGTIVLVETRHQKYYLKVYETARCSENMLIEEGAFATLSDMGTILGDEIGDVKYAGSVPMPAEEIHLLGEDAHAFEKMLRGMADDKPYHYVIFMQSYGPTYGHEEPPAEKFSDRSGPLLVYDRVSSMEDDVWEHWYLTDNFLDPYGSQTYHINTWYQASTRDWFYKGLREYHLREYSQHFKGWALPQQAPLLTPIVANAVPEPSALAPIEVLSAPGPVVMLEVVSYEDVEHHELPIFLPHRRMLSCCPFGKSSARV